MKTEKISQGLTFKGIISTIGMIVLIAGLIITIYGIKISSGFSFIIAVIGIVFLISGFVLFISIRGVLIDVNNMLIKPYLEIFISKLGNWESLQAYDKIILKYTNESQTLNSRGNSTNFITKSFDVVLISEDKKDLILKEFTDYDEAKSFLTVYSKRLNKEAIDTYEIIKQRIQERKQEVRR
jgi:hypothetical protein